MEDDIQHALQKIKRSEQKTIAHLEYVIKQIKSDLNSPPPQERFDVPTHWKSHMCLSSCLEKFEVIKSTAEDLHHAIENEDIKAAKTYLKEAPSLRLFADENGKTIQEKAKEKKNDAILKILNQIE